MTSSGQRGQVLERGRAQRFEISEDLKALSDYGLRRRELVKVT